MYYLISIIIIIVSILLVLVVLVQNSKGGGLASNFSSSNQIMGVRKTGDFLEKATWGLVIAMLSLSLLSNFAIERPDDSAQKDTELREQLNKTTDSDLPPSEAPAEAPAQP